MNIQKEIEEMKQSMLEDLAVLVAIPSVLDEAGARVHAPFGKEIRRAFDAFIKIAERLGFTVNKDLVSRSTMMMDMQLMLRLEKGMPISVC